MVKSAAVDAAAETMLPADAAADLSRRLTALEVERGEGGDKPETQSHAWLVAVVVTVVVTVLGALLKFGWREFQRRRALAKGNP